MVYARGIAVTLRQGHQSRRGEVDAVRCVDFDERAVMTYYGISIYFPSGLFIYFIIILMFAIGSPPPLNVRK